MTEENNDSQWHLDKRVPIALLIGLLMHGGGTVWWASGMTERMSQVERRLEGFSGRSQAMDRELGEQGRTIAVLVEQIDGTNRALERLHAQMEATNNLLRQLIADVAVRGAER